MCTEFVLFLGDPKHLPKLCLCLGKNTKKESHSVVLASRRSCRLGSTACLTRADLREMTRCGCQLGLRDEVVLVHGAHPQTKSFTGNRSLAAISRAVDSGNTFLKCTFLMAAGSKSSLSIYGVIAFPIAPQVEETRPSAQYTNDDKHCKKCTWITLSGMLSLSKLNKRSKSALGSCKISWQLLFIITHSIRVSGVTSWDPKFRPSGWFPNSHRSSSLECLDHFSSPWVQKMEASFDTNLAQHYFTQTRFSKGSTGFSWNLNDKYNAESNKRGIFAETMA